MKAESFENLIDQTDDDIRDFTIGGECSCYGNCCFNFLPLSKNEIYAIKKYIREHNIKECKHLIPVAQSAVDLTCPFLDMSKKEKVPYISG